jgi:photosystem II stability/assembly factor-like uncharacterized protein
MKRLLLTTIAIFTIAVTNAQWLNQNAGFSNDTLGFYEMSVVNENTVWAICYDGKNGLFSNRLILDFTRTVNGGTTWVPGKMGTDTTLAFSNISAVSKDEAWVAMHKRYGQTGGGIYHTTDGGVTWSQSGAGEIFDGNSFPDFVYFKDRHKGVAMGDPNNGYFEIYTTDNGGDKWKRVKQNKMPALIANEYGFISGYAALDNTIWFGTTAGRMFRSTNFGKDWSVYTVDPGGKAVFEIAFNDDKLHGVTHLRNNNATFLYSTNDGGVTWTNLGQPAGWKSSRITAVPGTDALVATSVNGFDKGSSISYDNGATWTVIESLRHKAVCRFFNKNAGWAGGFFVTGPPFSGGIYKSEINFLEPAGHHHRNNSTGSPGVSGTNGNDADVKIFPSPAKDIMTISLPEPFAKQSIHITVLNPDGKILKTMKSEGVRTVRLNVSDLSTGAYFVRISGNDQTINKMFTVTR